MLYRTRARQVDDRRAWRKHASQLCSHENLPSKDGDDEPINETLESQVRVVCFELHSKTDYSCPERSSQHLPTFSHNHVTNVSITTTMMMASGSEGSNHPSSDPNYNTSTTGFIHSNNSNGSSTINSNDNRMMRDMEDSLRQIEDGLDVDPNSLYRPFSAGRATWQSMSSALTNLRGRVNEFCESHGGDWGHQISERLSSAELAHSTRTPLRRLGSALGRRCQQTVTSPAAHSASSALGASQSPNAVASALEAAANAIAAAAASSTPRIEGAVDGRAPEEPITPPLHPSSSLPSSSSASSVITSSTDTSATGRRRSVLHASRSLPSLSPRRLPHRLQTGRQRYR